MLNNTIFQETVELFLNAHGQFVVVIRYNAGGDMRYVWSTGDMPTLVARFEPDRDILSELFNLVHPDDLPNLVNFVSLLVYDKYSSIDFRIVLKGSVTWLECQGSLLDINKESSSRYIALVMKHSVERIPEQQRIRYHLLLKSLMDQVSDPLIFCDKNEKVIYFNEAFSLFLGLDEFHISGRTLRDLMPYVEDAGLLELPLGFGIKESVQKTAKIILPNEKEISVVTIQKIVQNSIAEITGRIFGFMDNSTQIIRTYEPNRISRMIEQVIDLLALVLKPVAPIAPVADKILDILCEAVSCNDGFVSSIDPKTGECNGLTLTALLAHEGLAIGVRGGKARFSVGADGKYPGIWGEALNKNEAVLLNKIQDTGASVILAAPHFNVRNYLAVPIVLGTEKVGVIALANAKHGFLDAHIEIVNYFGGFLTLALQKQKDEEHKQRMVTFVEGKQAEVSMAGSLVEEYTKKLEENIEQARESQKALMELNLPIDARIQIRSGYQPSELIGGDIFNVFAYDDFVIFYLADIAGHGIPSALLSTYVKACLDNWVSYHRMTSTSEIIETLGKTLREQTIFRENLLTIFVGRFDLVTRTLLYTSAGHPFPLIFSGGTFISPDKRALHPAISPDIPLATFHEKEMRLAKDAKLFLYSDGLIEWLKEDGHIFGTKGLMEKMNEAGLTISAVNQIFEKSSSFPDRDDVSFMLLDTSKDYTREYYIGLQEIAIPVDEFNRFIETRYPRWMAFRICVCFSEVVANAIEHGNKGDKTKKLIVHVKCRKKKLVFSIMDEGKLKDYPFFRDRKVPPPEAVRGRGLIMINKFASKVKTNIISGGLTCVFLAKNFKLL